MCQLPVLPELQQKMVILPPINMLTYGCCSEKAMKIGQVSQVVLLRKGNQHFVDDPDVTESSRQALEYKQPFKIFAK